MTPLETAISQIGKEENPRGSNWGEDVQKYLQSVGVNFPAAWCAAFVYWCAESSMHLLGSASALPKTAGVLQMWNYVPYKDKNTQYCFKFLAENLPTYDVFPGDIFIMDFGKGLGHCGYVESFDPVAGTIKTVEGNTNNDGVREGYEVCRRERNLKNIKGFIRLIIK